MTSDFGLDSAICESPSLKCRELEVTVVIFVEVV